jgi:transposase
MHKSGKETTLHRGVSKMPKKKYSVKLSANEIEKLKKMTKTGRASAKEILHANVLLATDDSRNPKLSAASVASKCNTSTTTVTRVRKRYSEEGFEAAIKNKKRKTPSIEPKITGEAEARIIALACSEPPEGFSKWSLRLLAEKAVELEYLENVSHTSIGTVLKKHNLSLT